MSVVVTMQRNLRMMTLVLMVAVVGLAIELLVEPRVEQRRGERRHGGSGGSDRVADTIERIRQRLQVSQLPDRHGQTAGRSPAGPSE